MAHSVKNRVQSDNVLNVTSLAWPIMISMASSTVMDVTDTLMVGRLGTTELAAVGLATAVFFLCKSFFWGLLDSVRILVARACGQGNIAQAQSYGASSIMLVIPCALIIIVLSFFSRPLLALFSGHEDINLLAAQYFDIRSYFSLAGLTLVAVGNFFQGFGDTKTPMVINIVICILNVVLDAIFIYGFGPIPAMGVAGSAIASEIAIVVGCLLMLWVFLKSVKKPLCFNKAAIKELFSLGWPSGVRWQMDMLGYTVFTALVAYLGQAEIAANQIAIKVLSLSILPGWGISEAASIIIAHHRGAGRKAEVKRAILASIKLGLLLMITLGIAILLFKNALVSLFKPEPLVMVLATQLVALIIIPQLLETMQNILAFALNGMGDTRFPMFLTTASAWTILIPLAYLSGIYWGFGLEGMWLAYCMHLLIVLSGLSLRIFFALRTKSDEKLWAGTAQAQVSGPKTVSCGYSSDFISL